MSQKPTAIHFKLKKEYIYICIYTYIYIHTYIWPYLKARGHSTAHGLGATWSDLHPECAPHETMCSLVETRAFSVRIPSKRNKCFKVVGKGVLKGKKVILQEPTDRRRYRGMPPLATSRHITMRSCLSTYVLHQHHGPLLQTNVSEGSSPSQSVSNVT